LFREKNQRGTIPIWGFGFMIWADGAPAEVVVRTIVLVLGVVCQTG
jgi:hypothetical protein